MTVVLALLKAWFADTAPDGYQPPAVCTAVHLRRLELLRVVDARSTHLDKCRVAPCHSIGKMRQVVHGCRTLLIEDPQRDKSNACANILKGQVEAFFVQVADIPHLSVQFHDTVANVGLCEALIGSDGVDLDVLALLDEPQVVVVGLVVVHVERLFASPRDPGQAVAVTQRELNLDVDALSAVASDVASAEPVVLVGLHHVAHLVRAHGRVALVHHADLLPLQGKRETN